METILVVDDERDILELVAYNLEKEGFHVITVETGTAALDQVRSAVPDLVVLDLMLPDVDGLAVCKQLKAERSTASVPILMLTAKSEDTDVVAGLELGADDYLTKPFSPRVLTARIRAVLRRYSGDAGAEGAAEASSAGTGDGGDLKGRRVQVGELVMDRDRHQVFCGGAEVGLSATEFKILWFLASYPSWVFTRAKIIDAIRGGDYPVTERAVDVQILGLRRKLGEYGRYIQTVHGVGYRLAPDR
ncbi:MAG: response regulator [Spirochaetota bacterium]